MLRSFVSSLRHTVHSQCKWTHIMCLHTIGATFLPFELVVFGVSCPCGAEAHQLGCDVSEAPLKTSGALLPQITIEKQQFHFFSFPFFPFVFLINFTQWGSDNCFYIFSPCHSCVYLTCPLKGIALDFMRLYYSIPCQELDEKMDISLMSCSWNVKLQPEAIYLILALMTWGNW